MKGLEAMLNRAKIAYYNGQPFMSDEVYDRLEDTYKKHTGELSIGATLSGDRYPHAFPMYSLQKVYVGEKNPASVYNLPTVVSPKLDGAAVSLQYIGGVLNLALTRGDGKEGLDITDKMRTLVPNIIDTDERVVQITGEVVAPLEVENARNYAAGALNLKDVEQFKKRRLLFVAYNVEPSMKQFYIEDMAVVDSWLFDTCLTQKYENFPQDGTVWRIDSNKAWNQQGHTSHHPRGSFALKEKKDGVITTLLDVVWQVGKSGAVSPVAILKPCIIGEATVSKATLHNMGIIEDLNLEIGCQVEVIRAGEIIPQIVARVD
tara:strand:+ start:114 stop:1067 length:954 start_codon:yes stop_codon:yes gene_type:complete